MLEREDKSLHVEFTSDLIAFLFQSHHFLDEGIEAFRS